MKKPCKEATTAARPGMPAAYYQLHALLETVRELECHEDELCTLVAAIQRGGKVGVGVRRELLKVLESMPVRRLEAEMDACFEALDEAAA